MPNLFNSLSECLGFSQTIKLLSLIVFIALSDMSKRFPIGVATMYKPLSLFFILTIFTIINSCTPVNLYKSSDISVEENNTSKIKNKTAIESQTIETKKQDEKELVINNFEDTKLDNTVTIIFSKNFKRETKEQFVDILQLAVDDKKLENVNFEIEFFEDHEDFRRIIKKTSKPGKIYVGPIDNESTELAINYCELGIIFFSFASDTNLANDCVFLINFFPKNELEQLFNFLKTDSKVAVLYPENEYGYKINSLVDSIAYNSEAIIVNRSSYKNDLSNVRTAIKELSKYELRKYELSRQKTLLSSKKDEKSKKRLKKLEKFKTTSDYDFTHILIADYGLNLLQVAPLLTYYDVDPKIVQFMGTGVIDDQNFFFEPSLQGAIFPGIQNQKRSNLLDKYHLIYDKKFRRISTLPYDLLGLLNYVYSNNKSHYEFIELLNNEKVKFEGVDGNFYFKNNMIERELDILKITSGKTIKIN